MTRVQKRFELARPLDEALLARVADAHAVYGFLRIVPAADLTSLDVEYDATRFAPADVAAQLEQAGIPVLPK